MSGTWGRLRNVKVATVSLHGLRRVLCRAQSQTRRIVTFKTRRVVTFSTRRAVTFKIRRAVTFKIVQVLRWSLKSFAGRFSRVSG